MASKSMIDKLVYVLFLDHSMSNRGESGVIPCAVYGKITKEDERHFEITTWEIKEDTTEKEENEECFSILKGAIIEMRELELGRYILRSKKPKNVGTSSKRRK